MAETQSRARNFWLLLMSYVFYGWWNPWFILLMLFVSVANYVAGQFISRPGATLAQRRFWLILALVVSLGTLVFFKYFMFFQTNLNQALGWFGGEGVTLLAHPPAGGHLVLHVPGSQLQRGCLSRRRSTGAILDGLRLLHRVVPATDRRSHHPLSHDGQPTGRTGRTPGSGSPPGPRCLCWGFPRKSCWPIRSGESPTPRSRPESLTALDAWFGVTAYAFQIYFDFSGYSDMAVGLGRMLGFEFIKNFNAPYRAESITDFWRRWHISLSTFLRDYLYIPLGGNRRGTRRTYVNLTIVMLLGGLWHGANWTFIVWGAYHGLLLALERWLGKQSLYHRLPQPMRIGMTFVLVLFSWVLFRAETLGDAVRYFGMMFGAGELNVGIRS